MGYEQKKPKTTKNCKHCKMEIPIGAKVCPYCRKKQGNGCLTGIVIFLVVILLFSCIGMFAGDDDAETETTAAATTASGNSVQEEETEKEKANKELNLEDELTEFSSGEYLFVTNEDLSKYCVNMEGVKVYVVTDINDIKNDMIQSTLGDGYMMSSFNVSENYEKYESSLEKGDIVAIMGTVSGHTGYGFMGQSVDLDGCKVFAVGDDAEHYKKDITDDGLSDYLVVTEAVANNSDISEEEYKALCEKLSYEDILRNPDNNKDKYCVVSGTVDQIIEGLFGSYTFYITDSSGNKWGCTYSYAEGESHLLENDRVTIYGKCKGTSNTTTVMGKQVTLPHIEIEYIN